MFEKIIVPLDGSQVAARALGYATALAERFNAALTLVSVVAPDLDNLGVGDIFGVTSDVRRAAERKAITNATDYLESVAAPLRACGIACAVAVHRGNPAEEIIACAGNAPGTLIAMSTHGRTGFQRWRIGSVAQHVMRHAPVPTFVVRAREDELPDATITVREITVPLDGSPLAETALPTATALADAFGVRLVLLNVLSNIVYPASYYDTAFVPSNVEEARADEEGVEAYLADVAARIAMPTRVIQTLRQQSIASRPEEAISEYLKERPAGMVVMASHGRGGILRWAVGSTAEGMMTQSPQPLLIIRAGTVAPARATPEAATTVSGTV